MSLYGQPQDKVDFIKSEAFITVDPYKKSTTGHVDYTFNTLEKTDAIFLDAKHMQFTSVTLNNRRVKFINDGKTIRIERKFKQGKEYKLSLTYYTVPKQTVYFIGWQDKSTGNNLLEKVKGQVWTQGQGKYTSHWLPSFDDMKEKVEFDLHISFDKDYQVVANGKLRTTKETDSVKTWSFDMERPMSSYLLAFAIGDYGKISLRSDNGTPLEMYYYPKDSNKVGPTYRYTKRIFNFLEKEIGVPYPWQNYKQVPVRDFLYAGMENTGTTIFSDAFVVDSVAFVDKNYVNVNAHEMAHQWFGNLVTELDGNHHWLHEGFATYYALLAEKEVFGEDYFYWKLYETATQLDELSKKNKGEALTNPKASSITFYEKGAWALHILREEIGETFFKKGVRNYLLKYQFKNVTVQNFMEEMELASTMDLSKFEELWLNGTDFPYSRAKRSLVTSSKDLEQFFKLQRELTVSPEDNEIIIKRYWNTSISHTLKENIIYRYHKSLSDEFLSSIFEIDDVKVRQALALALEQVPSELKSKYESLLTDQSYITIENVLYKLWGHYPQDRITYLNLTRNIEGFANKNVRLVWLSLALLTKGYEEENKQVYYAELAGYTSPYYSFELRQGAFQWLDQVFGYTDQNLKDLINASVHHSWQFRKFARQLLDKLLGDEKYKNRFMKLSEGLTGKELNFMTKKLDTE